LIFFGSIDVPTPCGVVAREFLSCGSTDWLAFFQFWYEGEMYEYTRPVGPSTLTPKEAEDIVQRSQALLDVYREFLDDLDLETKH
jgi:hypothetical protein